MRGADRAFVNRLARDFKIKIEDRAALGAMVERARLAYRDPPELAESGQPLHYLGVDMWNAADLLRRVLRHLGHLQGRAGGRVVSAAREAGIEGKIEGLLPLLDQFRPLSWGVGGPTKLLPQNRPPDYHLHALAEVVASYWKEELRQPFKVGKPARPYVSFEAVHFACEVVEHIAGPAEVPKFRRLLPRYRGPAG